ncbi:MAG: NAD(P)-dependent oxidoreductase [Chloroflexi bacterium]|nr:NAD(P)-dependent oxidoreductase [Chloroflexota bacterium]
MKTLRNERILFTGLTGQIGFPLAVELAKNNEVWGLARFRDKARREEAEKVGLNVHAAKREEMEELGIITRMVDLADPDFSQLPDDFTYVIHFAAYMGGGLDFDHALRSNAEGTGLLMSHCRKARAFFVMSTCSIYETPQDPYYPVKETDPLGGARSVYTPTYAVSKTAEEAVARFVARQLNLPTIIARMNTSYGPNGGLPAYQFDWMLAGQPIPTMEGRPSVTTPIHQDDINAQIAGLLAAASVPATIVNWGGDDAVDEETYCRYMGEIAGLKPEFLHIPEAVRHIVTDNTRRRELVGDCRVKWREGMRQMIAARHPELKLKA